MLFGDEQVKKIRSRFSSGESVPKLAQDFGCSLSTAYNIVAGRAYPDKNYRPPEPKKFNLDLALSMKLAGASNYQIARAIDFSHECVRRKLNHVMGTESGKSEVC